MGKCRANTQTQVCLLAERVYRVCLQSLFAEPVHLPALATPLIVLSPGTISIRGPWKCRLTPNLLTCVKGFN